MVEKVIKCKYLSLLIYSSKLGVKKKVLQINVLKFNCSSNLASYLQFSFGTVQCPPLWGHYFRSQIGSREEVIEMFNKVEG